ncbi:hypothetical protein Clacol_008875 [Clathrus columnatus]|uniref:Importin N-terminal domain-containing protein n=1 Tax=Clathrus columnatus TaxID=1419009 RepID=A0AAV5AIZ9_9AGAM|nr:hypothetical protein Clacol_008875 [Clathrus columnatus]
MSELSSLLLASLSPQSRKQAEQSLSLLSAQPGFLRHLLILVLNASEARGVRLAGSVYFKNVIKQRWPSDAEEAPISLDDKNVIRPELVRAMISLSSPADKPLRAQIAESVSIVASYDFPERWPDLITQLVSSLSTVDYSISLGVLETAHSIFYRWRSAVRSNELYTVINYVLDHFVAPFVSFFRETATILLSNPNVPNLSVVAQAQAVLMSLFYDLTCQDLPPLLEDNHAEFFGAPDGSSPGWFLQFLAWDPPALRGDSDDTTPSVPSQIKTVIMEIAELYTNRFPELFSTSSAMAPFVQSVWTIIGGGGRPSVADDHLVAQCLKFLSTSVRSGLFQDLFRSPETIGTIVTGIVVPNVELRDHEIEQFEDDPLEYLRIDLSVPLVSASGSEGTTRRHAAADVLRALVNANLEAETTSVVLNIVSQDLQAYKSNPSANWKQKDRAIFLISAIASRGWTVSQGVTSTNALIKVVDWYVDNVLGDLQAGPGSIHPILQVDAIRYLYIFRYQLNLNISRFALVDQGATITNNPDAYHSSSIPELCLLFIRCDYIGTDIIYETRSQTFRRSMFTEVDIRDQAGNILTALFVKLEGPGTPEKIAENDYLMKTVMRVIMTARQSLLPIHEQILARLVQILSVISKNPSNPNFDQYLFESISALIRFIVAANPDTLSHLESVLQNVCTVILQQDIEQFVPYVFQILSQLLELHSGTIPAGYRGLLPLLLTPAPWAQKGSIPGIVRYIKACLAKDGTEIARAGQFTAMLAVAQQRLIPSKVNDNWGFELLQGSDEFDDPDIVLPIILSLLTRLQANKTDKFANLFAYFLLYIWAIQAEGFTPDYVIGVMEGIQAGLWGNLFTNIMLPEIPKMPVRDRRVAVAGLTRLLTESSVMRQGPNAQLWVGAFVALAKFVHEPQTLQRTKAADLNESDTAFTTVDLEEQNAGYQAAYSRLAASEVVAVDPIPNIPDVHLFMKQELTKAVSGNPQLGQWIQHSGATIDGLI